MRITLDIQPKHLLTVFSLLIMVIGFSLVVASPLGTKPDPGHSGSEIQPGSIMRAQIADNAVGSTELLSDAASLSKVSGGKLSVSGNDIAGLGNVGGTGVCIGTDCRTAWPSGSGGGITGSGTASYLAKWTGASALGNSVLYDNGNVGIATTSPDEELTVHQTSANIAIRLGKFGAGDWLLSRSVGNTFPSGWFGIMQPGAAAPAVVVDTSNRVGIGVNTPTQALDVAGSVQISGNIRGATYGFGGMYSEAYRGSGVLCEIPNPATSACNCPSGFTSVRLASQVSGFGGNPAWYNLYFCYK